MDSSNSRSTSSRARASDRERDDKGGIKLKIPPHRPTRYKEKFQALRERYDRVTTAHESYQRDLNIAAAKMKEIQAENDLLLDAISIADPDITRTLSPLPQEANSQTTPAGLRADNGISTVSRTPHLPPQHPHLNGGSNARHPNGNHHRPIKPEEHDFPGDHTSFVPSSRV